jgi:predicted Fe-Mo cluster-binding NifX family protein
MGKIAVAMSSESASAPLSEHFGKAEWIMLVDEQGVQSFMQNEGSNGRGTAEILLQNGCTDAIFTGIGGGALVTLKAAGIKGWAATKGVSGERALELFARHALRAVEVPIGHKESGGGCCCGHGAGKAEGSSSSCCRQ